MDADEVYSELGEKISTISDKLGEVQGTIDSLHESITATKSVVDKMQSDAQDASGKKQILNTWEASKKEILGVWETGKKDLMNSVSDYTTKAIKDTRDDLKNEIQSTVKGWFSDEDLAKKSAPKPVTEEELEEKVRA